MSAVVASRLPQPCDPWQPQANLAIWRRDLSPCLSSLAQGLARQANTAACFWVARDQDGADLALHAFAAAAWPSRPAAPLLAADIAALLGWFWQQVECDRLHVDLRPVRSNACRFFHTDKVGLRLLCSYAGPGTEWLPDAAANRAGLGRGDNAAAMRDPGQVQRLQRGWAALLQGERDPPWHGKGIVHRSPPYTAGQERLVLTIDEPGPHLDH